jgi:hypothetical protein
MTATHDWRYKDENFQKRHFILSSFVRLQIPLTRDVYEFCDHAISHGYSFDLGSLFVVDKQISQMYQEYLNEVNQNG